MKYCSESIAHIATALAAASKEIGGAVKGSANPFFKSRYADLASVIAVVKEPLEKQGITILQPMSTESGQTHLQTVLLHSSGEYISSKIPLDMTGKEQALGSRISYLRRYQLQAMLSIPSVDDDGEAAMAPHRKPKQVIKAKKETLISPDQEAALRQRLDTIENIDIKAFEKLLFEKFGIPDMDEIRLLNTNDYEVISRMLDKKESGNGN